MMSQTFQGNFDVEQNFLNIKHNCNAFSFEHPNFTLFLVLSYFLFDFNLPVHKVNSYKKCVCKLIIVIIKSILETLDQNSKFLISEKVLHIDKNVFPRLKPQLVKLQPWKYNNTRNSIFFSVSKIYFIFFMTPIDSIND